MSSLLIRRPLGGLLTVGYRGLSAPLALAPPSSFRPYTIKTDSTTFPIVTALSGVCSSPPFAKFDETVSLHLQVTLDPRKPNQNIREKISLPHGTGKRVSILVLSDDVASRDVAVALGASVPEGTVAEAVKALTSGDLSLISGVDRVITTPGDMRGVGALGRVLGPRGLMPNPKLGGVTADVGKAVEDAIRGEVIVRVNKEGGIFTPIGKVSMGYGKLRDNCRAVLEAVSAAKPTDAKGVKVRTSC